MLALLQSAIILLLGLGLIVLLVMIGAIWYRLRGLPLHDVGRLMNDLARRQRELEALIARLEASRPESAETVETGNALAAPKPGVRTVRRIDPAQANPIPGPTLIAVPDMSAEPPPAHSAVAAELGTKFGALWEMADAGASAASIAERSGQPIGQVELILALRRQLPPVGLPARFEERS